MRPEVVSSKVSANKGGSIMAKPKLSQEELTKRITEKAKELWERKGRVQNQDSRAGSKLRN